MPHLNIGLDKKEHDRFNILLIRFKVRDQAELIHILNNLGEDVLDGRLVHVPKRTPIKPIDKDSFSDALAEARAEIPETPFQTA
jgi:hypothetical protein